MLIRVDNEGIGQSIYILIRPRRGSIRRDSVESPILVQRNHGIICRSVRQAGKEAPSVCLTSELLTAATGNHLVGEGYIMN